MRFYRPNATAVTTKWSAWAPVALLLVFSTLAACADDNTESEEGPTGTSSQTSSSPTADSSPVPQDRATEVGRIVRIDVPFGFAGAPGTPTPPRLEEDTRLYEGDDLWTDDDGLLVFQTDDVHQCNVHPNSQIYIRPNAEWALEWHGTMGVSNCVVKRGEAAREFGIKGSIGLEVVGTIFQVELEGAIARVAVLEGVVEVNAGSRVFRLEPRQQLVLDDSGSVQGPQSWQPLEEHEADFNELRAIADEQNIERLVSVIDLQPSDCFLTSEAPAPGEIIADDVALLSECAGESQLVLRNWVPVDANEYPGPDKLGQQAIEECGDDGLFYLIPSEDQWNELGFQQVGCVTPFASPPS